MLLVFGFDSKFIFSPFLFKIKEWFKLIKPFNLPPMESVSHETLEMCSLFDRHYKQKCIRRIARNQRFHTKYYEQVFTGRDLVTWLLRKHIVQNRRQGVEFGRRLIIGRIMHHVSTKRNFYDNFNFYTFNA